MHKYFIGRYRLMKPKRSNVAQYWIGLYKTPKKMQNLTCTPKEA